tara:strand:+ start:14602 stop:14802 length:201 start_codon:yes stop_codon:yes gene_type:complete
MDLEEYAEMKKMKAYRYNKLASLFTKALEQPSERLRLIYALDKAHMEDEFSNHTIKKILRYFEEDE